jgi:hypothetical protein
MPQLKIVALGDRGAAGSGARIGWGGILSNEGPGIFRSQDDRGTAERYQMGRWWIAMHCMPRPGAGRLSILALRWGWMKRSRRLGRVAIRVYA